MEGVGNGVKMEILSNKLIDALRNVGIAEEYASGVEARSPRMNELDGEAPVDIVKELPDLPTIV